jgi:hypothetical protein
MSEEEQRRYLVVNTAAKTIVDGPFLWVGDPQWEHPDGSWMPEGEALEAGYTRPPMPVEEAPAEGEPVI